MRGNLRVGGAGYLLLLLTTALLTGCAPKKKEEVWVWPPPPEKPRIKYIASYRGESDFKKVDILSALLGEPRLKIELMKPYGVWARGEKIYVVDTAFNTVFIFDLKEKEVKLTGRFMGAVNIAGDSRGRLWVSDAKAGRVYAINEEGKFLMGLGKNTLKRPTGLAVDESRNRLYVVDTGEHNVKVFDLDSGELLLVIGRRGSGDGEFNYPTNIAVDRRTGNLVVVDTFNFRVQILDPEGNFIRKFGQPGNRPGDFYRPKGVGVDSEGHIYVADAAFDNFQIFDQEGRLLLFVGQAGSGPGQFHLPAGLYIDERDRIYVVDQFNRRVQVFQYLKHPEEE